MRNENVQLLNEVIKDRLELAYNLDPSDEEYNSKIFGEAMKSIEKANDIDRIEAELKKIELELQNKLQIEREKIEAEHKKNMEDILARKEVEMEKISLERERLRVESQKNCNNYDLEQDKLKTERILKVLEVAAVVVITPLIDNKFRTKFAKMICNFEKDYNFTTTAGRSLSSLFKFK